MYYHILLKTDETGEIYEFDLNSLDSLKKDIIVPYLSNDNFQVAGYFFEPSKIKRFIISQTIERADYYVNKAYDNLGAGIFIIIDKKDCVFSFDKMGIADITRKVLEEVKLTLKSRNIVSKEKDKNKVNHSPNGKTIFIAYSFRQVDDEFIFGFKELLIDKGYKVLDGKADGLGSISQAILEKISISDIVVIVMTKRDKKENGSFTTSAWLLEEKGAAIAFKKDVAMFVEEEIDLNDIGGLQCDGQRFHFTRNNFLKIIMNFIKILEDKE